MRGGTKAFQIYQQTESFRWSWTCSYIQFSRIQELTFTCPFMLLGDFGPHFRASSYFLTYHILYFLKSWTNNDHNVRYSCHYTWKGFLTLNLSNTYCVLSERLYAWESTVFVNFMNLVLCKMELNSLEICFKG